MGLVRVSLYERQHSCSVWLWLPYAFLMVWISHVRVRGRVYILSSGTHKHTLSACTLPTTTGLKREEQYSRMKQKETERERAQKGNPKCEFHISVYTLRNCIIYHSVFFLHPFLHPFNHSLSLFLWQYFSPFSSFNHHVFLHTDKH